MNARPILVAGVDEAGRGPLAGPVVVAAVILDPSSPIEGLADSKRLSEKKRIALAPLIMAHATAWHIEVVEVQRIDEMNILQATLWGMRRSIEQLSPVPQMALIDGNQAPTLPCGSRTIIKGDQIEPCISAASILAKVHRDQLMADLHGQYPDYGFDRHKGYPTAHHLEMLRCHGPCPQHRRSYAPVRAALRCA